MHKTVPVRLESFDAATLAVGQAESLFRAAVSMAEDLDGDLVNLLGILADLIRGARTNLCNSGAATLDKPLTTLEGRA